MSHRLYRLLWRSYILSKELGAEEQSPPWTLGSPRVPDLSHPCSEESPCLSTPACPSFLTGKQKSQRCARLIKSSWNGFAYTGNAGTYSKQKIFEDSFIHIGLFFFATAKNGISLPVTVIIIKKCFPDNFDIQKAPEWKSCPKREQKPDVCSRNTDTPSGNAEGRLSHAGSNSGRKQKQTKKPISVSNANTVTKAFCFSRPHALKEQWKSTFLLPSQFTVHRARRLGFELSLNF